MSPTRVGVDKLQLLQHRTEVIQRRDEENSLLRLGGGPLRDQIEELEHTVVELEKLIKEGEMSLMDLSLSSGKYKKYVASYCS